MCAQLQILIRVPQELHDLLQLLLFLVGAGHLVKGHPILAPAGHLHPGLAEFSHFVLGCSAAVHAAHKPHDQQKAQYPHDIRQQCRHPVGGMNKILLLHGAALHLLLNQAVHVTVKALHAADGAGGQGAVLQLGLEHIAGDSEGLHLLLPEIAAHIAVCNGAGAVHAPCQYKHAHHQQQQQQAAGAYSSILSHRHISF